MHSVHPVFHMFILKPTISNYFSKRTWLALTPVIINRESKYEISQIVDLKINCQCAYKLLYKVIWLGYEDTEDESKWISTSELTYATDLVFDFHITYSAKPSPLSLFWSYCCTCSLPLCTSSRNYYYSLLIYSICLFSFNSILMYFL